MRSSGLRGYEYADLATYNSEVARGILHTSEWKAQMAQRQAEHDARFASPRTKRWAER